MFTRVPLHIVAAGFATAFIFGCSESTPLPSSPSATPSANRANAVITGSASVPITIMGAGGHAQRAINILDACDPDSFNAAIGPGI